MLEWYDKIIANCLVGFIHIVLPNINKKNYLYFFIDIKGNYLGKINYVWIINIRKGFPFFLYPESSHSLIEPQLIYGLIMVSKDFSSN